MISIAEALKIIERETRSLETETIDLENSVGRILAEVIVADMNLPPFDRSQMDGFAIKSKDTRNAPVRLKIIGESAAGKGFDGVIQSGETVRIMTGARIPGGADAVQKVELTNETGGYIEILETAKAAQNINGLASEIKTGMKIFDPGERIGEQMIAAIASFGYAKIKVFRKPRVSILSTGSEIVDVAETPRKDQIRNSNSIMLKVFAERAGADAVILPIVQDEIETLTKQIAEAVEMKAGDGEQKAKVTRTKSKIQNLKSEILIISGGVSVGDYDYTKPALRNLGAEIFFDKICLKPGKPTVFAKLNDALIFGLPGNPVSSAVTFHLFARQAILQMQAAKNTELKKGFAVAASKIKAARERDSVLPASIETNKKGQLIIESLRFNGSSNFIAFALANALVFVPQGKNLEASDIAEIMFLR
jgi:molybdopterin biosynthesis enzyme